MPSLALNVRKKNIAPPCCPELDTAPRSDVLDFHYRQVYGTSESVGGNPVQVEVIVRTRLERITGAYSLGDLIYTNTLLPGEDVFLFTSDRRVRFAFDATTNITYRAENTLEDDFYMSSMGDFLADVTVKDEGKATNKTKGSLEGHADASSALQSAFGGSSVDMKGSFNAESTADFLNELTAHARASDHRSVTATHTASAISIGTVGTRQHAEGRAQDTFEASFRHFRRDQTTPLLQPHLSFADAGVFRAWLSGRVRRLRALVLALNRALSDGNGRSVLQPETPLRARLQGCDLEYIWLDEGNRDEDSVRGDKPIG